MALGMRTGRPVSTVKGGWGNPKNTPTPKTDTMQEFMCTNCNTQFPWDDRGRHETPSTGGRPECLDGR
jgi:hypothetical protein